MGWNINFLIDSPQMVNKTFFKVFPITNAKKIATSLYSLK